MRIAVDAMGGDHAPAVVIEGAVQAARDLGLDIIFVGQLEANDALAAKTGGGVQYNIQAEVFRFAGVGGAR